MKRIHYIPVLLLLVAWTSCLRPSDSDLVSSHSQPFKDGSLVTALSNAPSLKLFNKMFTRLGLARLVDSARGYTIFAPTDSALMAAGYTEQVLNNLPDDSLNKLITYHIATAAMDETAMQGPAISIKVATLRSDTSFDPATGYTVNSYFLYVLKSGDFFFNGFTVPAAGARISASNGYIFPVGKVLKTIRQGFLLDIIDHEPDLSMYREALAVNDSIRVDYFNNTFGDALSDSLLQNSYWLSHQMNPLARGYYPTVFAPTNAAFYAAGFHDHEDLVRFATSGARYGYTDDFLAFDQTPLDTLVGRMMLYNYSLSFKNSAFPVMALYGDLTTPAINNGVYNIFWAVSSNYIFDGYNMQLKDGLQFSAKNGVASMTWHNITITIPHDDDPSTATRNFVTPNGALYKVDKLFYPIH